jgi:ABC-2 type transport system permease protein
MVMNFLVMPLFFLSGAIYPLDGLPRVLAALTRVDPLTYGVDGIRGLMIGRTHFGIAVDLAVLFGVAVLFVLFGAWRFSKIEA